MVILMYLGPNQLECKYTVGTQSFVKTIPNNAAVAMKGLNVSEQIANRQYLVNHGVTIYDYERGSYYGQNTNTTLVPASGGTLPYIFVNSNTKATVPSYVSPQGWSGTTTASGMTISQIGSATSGVTSFVTYVAPANLLQTGQVSATTIGSSIYVSFSGASVSTTQWALAVLTGLTLSPGLTISGYDTRTLGAGATVNLGFSANTPTAGFINLQRLV